MKKKLLLLVMFIALSIPIWAEQVIILQDDFATQSGGDNTTTSGQSSLFKATSEFPTSSSAYQAGGSVKLGTGSKIGSLTSRSLDLSVNEGIFFVSIDVKGWSSIEGDIKITTGCTPASITKKYSAKMADPFETIIFEFSGGKPGTAIKIETTAKRAFVDNVKVYYEKVTTTPTIATNPTALEVFETTTAEPKNQIIKVSGTLLTEAITLSIGGTDAQYYSVTPTSLQPVDGIVADTDVTVTYKPTVAGDHFATLTLTSAGAPNIALDIMGTATLPTLLAPVATAATSITEKSFTANWDATPGATEYQLNVMTKSPTVVNDGTKEKPYSVSDSRNTSITGEHWICGYIVGTVEGGSSASGLVINSNAPFTLDSNIALADSPTETDGQKIIGVQLSSGTIRDALNLKTNGNNYKRIVKIKGDFSTYFNNPGVKNLTEYELDTNLPGEVPIAGSPFTVADATSFEVGDLNHNTTYRYSVIAKGNGFNDSMESNRIEAKTAELVTVEHISDIKDPNVYYNITESINGIWQVGNLVYVKNAKGGNPDKTTQPLPVQPNDDSDANFEQSSWLRINVSNNKNYANKTIDSGMIGRLNATSGNFDATTIADPRDAINTYNPFYTSNTEKYNSFRIENFFKPDAAIEPGRETYFVAPQEFEVAYICQAKYKEIDGKKYFVSGKYQIEVIETEPLPTKELAGDEAYNSKAIFLKQPKASAPTEKEWVIEHLGEGNVTTGVNDIAINGGNVRVFGSNGTIEIFATEASTINVYNLSGSVVSSINNANDHTTIEVPTGVYIVKVQNTAVKVIVK